jgi:hypothetical protein
MDLNHISLSPQLISDLYKNALIGFPKSQSASTVHEIQKKETKTAEWKYLGNNHKNILIVINVPEAVFLPDDNMTFLTGILNACKLSLADVALFNINNHPDASFKELNVFFQSKIVLLFDYAPLSFGLPVNFPHFQVQSVAHTLFLYSPSLNELQNDKLQKSKLWVCLRRIFGI